MTSSLYTCSCNSSSLTWLLHKRNFDHYGGFSLRRRALTVVALSQSRRSTVILISSLPFTFVFLSPPPPPPAEARERRKKKNIPIDDYITSRNNFLLFNVHICYVQCQINFYFHFSSAVICDVWFSWWIKILWFSWGKRPNSWKRINCSGFLSFVRENMLFLSSGFLIYSSFHVFAHRCTLIVYIVELQLFQVENLNS